MRPNSSPTWERRPPSPSRGGSAGVRYASARIARTVPHTLSRSPIRWALEMRSPPPFYTDWRTVGAPPVPEITPTGWADLSRLARALYRNGRPANWTLFRLLRYGAHNNRRKHDA